MGSLSPPITNARTNDFRQIFDKPSVFWWNNISSDKQTYENGPDRSPDNKIKMIDPGRHFQIDHRVGLRSPAEKGE